MVVRSTAAGPAVLLVHRQRYDDWSLPKGKLDPGEDHATAALREVLEETGLACTLGADLGEVRYVDHQGRDKRVRWWAMDPVPGVDLDGFEPNDEVDEVRWVAIDDVVGFVTYADDAAVVARLAPG